MPSKNKTELLKLNQWQENEYPKMDDFNDDNKKLDDAYKGIVNKLNDKADKSYVDEKISRASTIVIANYDSHENSKKGADIVINKGENAAKKINDAIQSLKGIGGEVKLMEGNYNLEYGIAVNVDGVHLTGIPGATVLIQNTNWKDNPYITTYGKKDIIDTRGLRVGTSYISNLTLRGAGIKDSTGFLCSDSSKVNNCISENSGSDGFSCTDSSKVTNCISENSGRDGFSCAGSSKVTNCISENSGRDGFSCTFSSKVTNCISENSGDNGFSCSHSSKVTNCISENSGDNGFSCRHSSKVTNCISENSGDNGFYCASPFKGVCGFNTLIGDNFKDDSTSPAVVQYNIIKEG